jgi:hypothetical protein
MKKFDFVVGQKVLILPEFGKDGEYPDTLEIGKTATVTSIVNSMSGEITLADGGVYLAFSDEIEAVEQGRSYERSVYLEKSKIVFV